jgi:hypothetical protein
MKTTFPIESHGSPAPGIIPEPSLVHDHPPPRLVEAAREQPAPPPRLTARRTPLARLLAALRGDKYMVDAYPPVVSPTKEG